MTKVLLCLLLAGVAVVLVVEDWQLRGRLAMLERDLREGARREAVDIRPVLQRLESLEAGLDRIGGRDAGTRASEAIGESTGTAPDAIAEAVAKKSALIEDLDALHEEIAALREWALEQDGIIIVGDGELPWSHDLRSALAPSGASSNPGKSSYAPDQVLGAPDAPGGGDSSNAWCPATADGGEEWIEVDFDPPVVARAIVVRETMNPGTVERVDGIATDGTLRAIWHGDYSRRREAGNLVVTCDPGERAIAGVRVTLDTARVPGWNEIDAICVLTDDGVRWGAGARASSVWESR